MPVDAVDNVRNDMYLTSEAIRSDAEGAANPTFDADTGKNLTAYKKELDGATKFIPLWVKVAVAMALGLGTMVGWTPHRASPSARRSARRHMTYAQGASAELVAMGTIGAADMLRPAGLDHPCALVGCRRHHGRQQIGPADVDGPEPADGLGADPAGGHPLVRLCSTSCSATCSKGVA